MKDAAEGLGSLDEGLADGLVDFGAANAVHLRVNVVELLNCAKDETVAVGGVHQAAVLELADGNDHLGELLGRVNEVGLSSARRTTGTDHNVNRDRELARVGTKLLELLEGGGEAAFVIRTASVEFDAGGAESLGLEGGLGREGSHLEVNLADGENHCEAGFSV